MRTPSSLQFDNVRRLPAARQTWPGVRIGRRWWLLGALSFYAFAFQGARGLWEPDEGRYTAVALEMERLGDYVVPHLHHEVRHITKPPLTYWLIAGSLQAFGHSEWAVRLPNSLAFLATILLVAGVGRRLAPEAPLLAPLIYATSLLPFVAANVVTTDTLLTLWETLAVFGFVELWWGPAERRGFYRVVTWLGFGLAFLTKGPPGLLPLAVIAVFVVAVERRNGIGKLISPSALLVFATVGLGWYLIMLIREPGILGYFVGNELFARVFTANHDRNAAWYGPFVIYGPSLLLGSLPWTGSLVAAGRGAWRSAIGRKGEATKGRDRIDLFLLLWLLLPLAVFVLARSRMHLYMLPLCVPLALLTARRRGSVIGLTLRRRAGLAAWILFLIALRGVAGIVPIRKDSRALAEAIRTSVRSPIDELVFVEMQPRYGLAFYLGTEVEAVTLSPRPAGHAWPAELLREELREEEGVRVFVVPRKQTGAFRHLSRTLGFIAERQGGLRELGIFRLQPSPPPDRRIFSSPASRGDAGSSDAGCRGCASRSEPLRFLRHHSLAVHSAALDSAP